MLRHKISALKLLFIVFQFQLCLSQNETYFFEDSLIRDRPEIKVDWDMSFTFKTMNYFRGLLPSRAPVFSTQAGVIYNNFVLGFYGGASTNGAYTETDLILMYYTPKFRVRLDWYYNFTEGITNIPTATGFFDFNPEVTRGLLDFMLGYQLADNWQLLSSTFLYGRDRDILQEDSENDIPLRSGDQRYTQYFKLNYVKKLNSAKLEAHAAYSFSWNDPSGATFYGDRPGFTDLGVAITTKLFKTNTVSIPFKGAIYVNTISNDVYLVGSIMILELSKL